MDAMKKFSVLFLRLTVTLLLLNNGSSSSSLFWKERLKEEIDRNRGLADQIIDHILTGPARGQVYERLAFMVDKFGDR